MYGDERPGRLIASRIRRSGNMIFLDQNTVIQAETVVGAALTAPVFFQSPQAGVVLRYQQCVPWYPYLFDITRVKSQFRKPLQQIERNPFAISRSQRYLQRGDDCSLTTRAPSSLNAENSLWIEALENTFAT